MSETTKTLELVKAAQQHSKDDIVKAFTQSNQATVGLQGYDLHGPALELFPVLTPLRNMLPRATGGFGSQANWKAFIGINGGDPFGGIAEAQRGAIVGQTLVEQNAVYKGFGQENSATFEADFASDGFDDAKARAVTFALKQTMISEEKTILFGKGLNSAALGRTPTPAVLNQPTGGSLPAGSYSVVCVYLPGKGFLSSSVATGVPVSGTIPSADGSAITYTGFNAAPSVGATFTATGSASSVIVSVPPARDVFAYAWYIGAAGSEKLVAITNTADTILTTVAAAGAQLVSALGANDNSLDPNVYEGLLTQAARAFNGMPSGYWKALQGTDGSAQTLTSDNAGGVNEINDALEYFYEQLRMSPTHLFVAAQQMKDIRSIILAKSGNQSSLRFNIGTNQAEVSGGSIVVDYFNPFAQGTGVQSLKIVLHPYLAPGTMFFYSDSIPYPMANVADICRVLLRRDYYQIEWPLRTRKYEYGIFHDGVLQHFFPQSMGIICNIAPGTGIVSE